MDDPCRLEPNCQSAGLRCRQRCSTRDASASAPRLPTSNQLRSGSVAACASFAHRTRRRLADDHFPLNRHPADESLLARPLRIAPAVAWRTTTSLRIATRRTNRCSRALYRFVLSPRPYSRVGWTALLSMRCTRDLALNFVLILPRHERDCLSMGCRGVHKSRD